MSESPPILGSGGGSGVGCGVGWGVGCGVGWGVGCGVGWGVGWGVGCGVGCDAGFGVAVGWGVGVGTTSPFSSYVTLVVLYGKFSRLDQISKASPGPPVYSDFLYSPTITPAA